MHRDAALMCATALSTDGTSDEVDAVVFCCWTLGKQREAVGQTGQNSSPQALRLVVLRDKAKHLSPLARLVCSSVCRLGPLQVQSPSMRLDLESEVNIAYVVRYLIREHIIHPQRKVAVG
jgi:hypothetical protein